MKITFLKASIPLTKTFTKTKAGIEKSSYPNVYEVTSIIEDCPSLKALAPLLSRHAALGHCMLKGNVTRPLKDESRAGSTDPNADSELLLLDVDGLDMKTPNEFMKAVGMSDVSYVVQYSTSYRIVNDLLRCHIFVWLDKPYPVPALKQHLVRMNFDNPKLRDALALTKTGNALRYGLDITTCQSDKLVYIADPVCEGFKPPTHKRIEHVSKKRPTWSFGDPPSMVANKALVEARIVELRKATGLPERRNVYRYSGDTEVLAKPDQGIVTGIKEERGFVYLNLNGGDSWGYYHPSNNPDFIRNFKGEPTYVTKDLLPDYWQQVCGKRKTSASSGVAQGADTMRLAFLDRKSSVYWRGTYDKATDTLDLYAAKNETQVRHYAAQSGFSLPDFIPEWDMIFAPHSDERVNVEAQVVNTFQRTRYMKPAPAFTGKRKKAFPTIAKIILHAVGSDPTVAARFMNWLGVIAQTLTGTRTAWVLHGCPGTGKGLLINKVLGPLFGREQVAIKRMEEVGEQYNVYMERCFFVFVDEVQTSTLRNESSVMAKLRNFITEPTISIRAMYRNAYDVTNHTNWIFASNMPDPVAIERNDRRYNVAKYQEHKLQITKAEVDGIESELQAFWDHLRAMTADFEAASTPMETEDRDTLMRISEASIDQVSRALLEGDMQFFIDQLPTRPPSSNVMMDLVEGYKATLMRLIKRSTDFCNINRDELRDLFEYTVGDMPPSPNKFTSRLKHHRIHTKRLSVDGLNSYGIAVKWKEIPADAMARLTGKVSAVESASTKNGATK